VENKGKKYETTLTKVATKKKRDAVEKRGEKNVDMKKQAKDKQQKKKTTWWQKARPKERRKKTLGKKQTILKQTNLRGK